MPASSRGPTRAGTAGAVWEPGSWRWLIEQRRIGPVIRQLQRATDPLFAASGWTWTRGDGCEDPRLRPQVVPCASILSGRREA
jgi:hypothetical protein